MRVKNILVVLVLMNSLNMSAQLHLQNRLDSFCKEFITNIRKNETLQTRLILDKSIYQPGEPIWFKAILMKSISDQLTDYSSNLIIDLVDEKDSVIKRMLLFAEKGQSGGQIIIPTTIREGNFWVRAYTREMVRNAIRKIAVLPIYIGHPSSAGANRFRIVFRKGAQIPIVSTSGGEIKVFPNPVRGRTISLQLRNQKAGKYTIRLVNSLGQQISTRAMTFGTGSETRTIRFEGSIPKGVYRLQIVSGESTINEQLIFE